MKCIFIKTLILLTLIFLSFKTTQAQFVTIPDTNFAAWLNTHYPSCMNGNLMDTTCNDILNDTMLSVVNYNINDLTGISYFDSLQILQCGSNNLLSLPRLPLSLSILDCEYNQITSLPDLPDSLTSLVCNYNQLTSLPNLPSNLLSLSCHHNQLTTIPILPGTITFIRCQNNLITSLPPLPNSITLFQCNNNLLTSLPNIPNLLLEFDCTNNLLTSLPNLPLGLKVLYCRANQLTNIPSLPAGIEELDGSYNDIVNLPSLPNSLKILICSGNQLSNLPTIPDSLEVFGCGYNLITNFSNLPSNLLEFESSSNPISSLPNLPNTLTKLYCNYNQLTQLPILPPSLKELYCYNNLLSHLPTLPSTLLRLNCSNNQLLDLPELPLQLNFLWCANNNIECFPVFPQSLINSIDLSNNPFLCLPNYVSAMNSILLSTPLCNSNNINGCISANGILGKVYKDDNANCNFDLTDLNPININIKFFNPLNNSFGLTNSMQGGIFNYAASNGTYLVLVDTLNKPFQANCLYPGIDSTVVTTVSNPLASNVNFDIKCKPGLDLNVQSVNHKDGLIFPGQQHTLQVMVGDASQWYGLNCANGSSGQVQITIAGPVTYTGTAAGALTPTVNGNVYTYTIADFGTIDNETDFQLLFTTNTSAQAGDQICVHVEVTPILGDINPTNNIKDYCYNVVNSYDPNYKEVYPTNVPPLFQDWLTYTIHFQNLGNAPAINIRLLDTLDNNLDAETFEVINYSHYNTVTMMDGIIDFRFPNILLPDSASNPTASQGFVQYRIKPKANLGAGTQIENTAHIYFDYNPAVVTNTTVNNFITTVSNKSLPIASPLWLYPNPSTGIFNISASANIEVYNLIGDLILSENNTTSIDLTEAPKGMYYVKLNGGKIEKLIKN